MIALALHATTSPGKVSSSAQIEAIWHVQSLPFEYRSLDTYYDCASLAQKVGAVLRLLGAHDHIFVETNCGGALANRIDATIVLATPVPATQENLRAASTFDAKDALIARLRQIALPTAADVKRFPAAWQTRRLTITNGDCDLLRGIHEQIFPKLAIRAVHKRKLQCHSLASDLKRTFKYEALIATPKPADLVAPQS